MSDRQVLIKKSDKTGQYWFNIVESNGQTLASSEQYAAKQSAKDAIESIKRGAADATVQED